MGPTLAGLGLKDPFGVGFDLKRRNHAGTTVGAEGDEGEERGDTGPGVARGRVFPLDLDLDLDAAAEGRGDVGGDADDLADLHRLVEGEVIDAGGDADGAAVALGADGRADVHPREDLAAEDVAEGVGVGGEHVLGHRGDRARRRAGEGLGHGHFFLRASARSRAFLPRGLSGSISAAFS